MSVATISPQRLAELCRNGKIDLIDVRTPVEFREVHVEQARNVPLDRLDPAAVVRNRNGHPDDPLYVICRSGSRGRQACEKFLAVGIANVVNVEGGTLACVEAGLPVARGKKAISLERQVRIAAGSFVLLGVLLGVLVDPAFLGLSAFVGAGLVFAGITDTCGMGILLARMPWNQIKDMEAVLAASADERPFLVDVRTPQEFSTGHILGAVNIPVDELRTRLGELPRDRTITVYCQVGQRGYLATRILLQEGSSAVDIAGGYKTYRLLHPDTKEGH